MSGRTALVTGGAGFIGSALCRLLVAGGATRVVVLDKLTYAASPAALAECAGSPAYRFVEGDIADRALVAALLAEERVDTVFHLAAETHVDRSIAGPAAFVRTNIVGTFALLEEALEHWRRRSDAPFRFHHVSTDEVHGDLPLDGGAFDEASPYRPSSPYSASKAASDHLVTAWGRTYGLPVTISSCSNNYGPWQSPDKLIPRTIAHALSGKPIIVYGRGANVRDWLHVDDHVRALDRIARAAPAGSRYAVGGRAERTNLAVVEAICDALDGAVPRAGGGSYREQIAFVADRAGHDLRYAIDPRRIARELGWRAERRFEEGLAATVDWYLVHRDWWRAFAAELPGTDGGTAPDVPATA